MIRLLALLFLITMGNTMVFADSIGIRIVTEGSSTDEVVVAYATKLIVISTLNPELTVLARLKEGAHKVDLTGVPENTEMLYFILPGYAPIFLPLKSEGLRVSQIEARLFKKRYLTVRYATDPGGPDFSLSEGSTLALTQFASLGGGAWQFMQGYIDESGINPWMHYYQVGSPRWGAVESHQGFDDMKEAPTGSVYVGRDYPLQKGSSFYLKQTQGYAKMQVVDYGTDRPDGMKILEYTPTFKEPAEAVKPTP